MACYIDKAAVIGELNKYPTVYWKESVKKVCKIPHVYPGYWDYVVGKDYKW